MVFELNLKYLRYSEYVGMCVCVCVCVMYVWACVALELRECEGDQYEKVYSCHASVRPRVCESVGVCVHARRCARVCQLPWLLQDQYDKWLPFPQTSLHSRALAAY